MKVYSNIFVLIFLSLMAYQSNAFADATDRCGPKPIPTNGCRVGHCMDGRWELICDTAINANACGTQPTPNSGCRIGKCVNGKWEEICSADVCGNKPAPGPGCRIGKCIDGNWEKICR